MYHWPQKHRLKLACLALVLGALTLLFFKRQRLESHFYGVTVCGDKAFIAQVEGSLWLLREKSPAAFRLTQRFAPLIEQSNRSGMRAYDEPPTFDLSPKTANYSVSWCAGSIAHDAFHSKLYHEYLDSHGGPVPDEEWSGQAKELECIHYQAGILKAIGAPGYEISYVSNLDGSHFDLDGDGKQTWIDYWLRDW